MVKSPRPATCPSASRASSVMAPPSSRCRVSSITRTPSMVRAPPYVSTWNTRLASGENSIVPPAENRAWNAASGVVDEPAEIVAVRVVAHGRRETQHVGRGDVAHAKRDLFDARDHQPLPFFQRLDEARRLEQRLVRTRVEPGDSAAQPFDVQVAGAQVREVDVGDLELAPVRRLERGRDVDHSVVVEVETGDRPRRARLRRLLLEAHRVPGVVE